MLQKPPHTIICPICKGKGSLTEDAETYQFVTRDPQTNTCLICAGRGWMSPNKKLPDGRKAGKVNPKPSKTPAYKRDVLPYPPLRPEPKPDPLPREPYEPPLFQEITPQSKTVSISLTITLDASIPSIQSILSINNQTKE